MAVSQRNVRFTPGNRHQRPSDRCRKCAKPRHFEDSEWVWSFSFYSVNWLAQVLRRRFARLQSSAAKGNQATDKIPKASNNDVDAMREAWLGNCGSFLWHSRPAWLC